jgi:hypothetical protein
MTTDIGISLESWRWLMREPVEVSASWLVVRAGIPAETAVQALKKVVPSVKGGKIQPDNIELLVRLQILDFSTANTLVKEITRKGVVEAADRAQYNLEQLLSEGSPGLEVINWRRVPKVSHTRLNGLREIYDLFGLVNDSLGTRIKSKQFIADREAADEILTAHGFDECSREALFEGQPSKELHLSATKVLRREMTGQAVNDRIGNLLRPHNGHSDNSTLVPEIVSWRPIYRERAMRVHPSA